MKIYFRDIIFLYSIWIYIHVYVKIVLCKLLPIMKDAFALIFYLRNNILMKNDLPLWNITIFFPTEMWRNTIIRGLLNKMTISPIHFFLKKTYVFTYQFVKFPITIFIWYKDYCVNCALHVRCQLKNGCQISLSLSR